MEQFECWACAAQRSYQTRHETVFVDSRTDRAFCHEHVAMLVAWELLNNDHPDVLNDPQAFTDWITPDGIAAMRGR